MVDFGAIIGESAEWTKQVLFKPFDFKKWMALTFIALMAGAMSNVCNFNSGGGNNSHYEQKQQQAGQGGSAAVQAPQGAAEGQARTVPPVMKQKPSREDVILISVVIGTIIIFTLVIV